MMENTNNETYWKKIKEKYPNSRLTFIHTPKCGGTYVKEILKTLNIRNNGHRQATKNDGITFTVIRDPVARFESLLNYRLGEKNPRPDWPKHLRIVYRKKDISLNQIVANMTRRQMRSFSPYKNLVYWSKNIHIFITIDKLYDFLWFFGYNYQPEQFKKANVSKKTRGTLNQNSKRKINRIFSRDSVFFQKVA